MQTVNYANFRKTAHFEALLEKLVTEIYEIIAMLVYSLNLFCQIYSKFADIFEKSEF